MGTDPEALSNERKYFFHFPDGNASIARLLVRKLIPEAMPGNSATDVVTARANYGKLDEKSSALRMRLNSTAVRVKHAGEPARATDVEVAYARGGKVYTVKANTQSGVLARVIPYICEELPQTQKDALAAAQKVPLLFGVQQELGKFRIVDVEHSDFKQAMEIETLPGARAEWNVQLVAPVSLAVKRGDILLARFWLRCIGSMTGEGYTAFELEQNHGKFGQVVGFQDKRRAGLEGSFRTV